MKPTTWVVSLVLILLIGVIAALSMGVDAGSPGPRPPDTANAAPDTSVTLHRVVASYFHTTQRCASCRKIESYTRKAIESGFPKELEDGRLVFRLVNLDEKGNEHFVKDYKLFTKSVILSDEHSGSQVRWKNLPKVWELLGNEEDFVRYIQEETRDYLTVRP